MNSKYFATIVRIWFDWYVFILSGTHEENVSRELKKLDGRLDIILGLLEIIRNNIEKGKITCLQINEIREYNENQIVH